jgi:hypothetical protein
MQPLVERLKEEGVEIESFEVWHNPDHSTKMDRLDRGRCGGVPFFINPATDKWICGETTYENLKKIVTE